jgi:hypothetical protein
MKRWSDEIYLSLMRHVPNDFLIPRYGQVKACYRSVYIIEPQCIYQSFDRTKSALMQNQVSRKDVD